MRRKKYCFFFITVFISVMSVSINIVVKADDAAGSFPKLNLSLEMEKNVSDNLLDDLTTSRTVAVISIRQDNFSLEGADEMPSEKSLPDEALGLLNKDAILLKYNKKF